MNATDIKITHPQVCEDEIFVTQKQYEQIKRGELVVYRGMLLTKEQYELLPTSPVVQLY